MTSTALTRIERSQKRLFRGIQNDLLVLEKNKSRELTAYEKSYKRIFRKPFAPSSREELIRAALRADIIFVADFHPFNQSQKTFLRILGDVVEQDPQVVIALECAQERYQEKIDYFLDGELTLEELREELHYSEHWPFSWKNYSHIFQYAKSAGIPLVALNISRRNGSPPPLAKRDKAAALTLAEIRERWPDKRIFVLYGELHIAGKHLPLETKRQVPAARLLLLYQNEPSLYWKVAQQVNSQHLEVLKLSEDQFCVMNAVPWVKLQSYLDWVEGNLDSDDLENQGLDLPSALHKRCEHIAEALGIPIPKLLDFDLQSGEATPYLQSLRKKELIPEEAKALAHAIQFQRPLVLPVKRLLFLPVISANSLSEAAALILHFSLTRKRLGRILPKENMSALILRYCVGYLGSKILNPKRKCNEEKDIRNFLRKAAGQRSLLWAEKELDWAFGRRISRFHPPRGWRNLQGFEAARTVGYILGDRIFTAIQKDPSLLHFALELFTTASTSKTVDDAKLRAIADSLPKRGLRLSGKREKL